MSQYESGKDNLINRNIIEKLNEVANSQNEEKKNYVKDNEDQEKFEDYDLD